MTNPTPSDDALVEKVATLMDPACWATKSTTAHWVWRRTNSLAKARAIIPIVRQPDIKAVNEMTARIAELEARVAELEGELFPRLEAEAIEDASYGFPLAIRSNTDD